MQGLEVGEWAVIAVVIVGLAWVIGLRLVLGIRCMLQGQGRGDVMALLVQAAEEMATHPARREAEEVAYLLEALAHRVDKETYRQVLEAVQGEVAARLRLAGA